MPVTGHQLKAIQLHLVTLKPFCENSLERFVVGLFAENPGTRVLSIQGMGVVYVPNRSLYRSWPVIVSSDLTNMSWRCLQTVLGERYIHDSR